MDHTFHGFLPVGYVLIVRLGWCQGLKEEGHVHRATLHDCSLEQTTGPLVHLATVLNVSRWADDVSIHKKILWRKTFVQGNTPQLCHSNKNNTKVLNATLHWKPQLTLQKSSPFEDCPQSCGCFVEPIAVLVVDPAVHGSLCYQFHAHFARRPGR